MTRESETSLLADHAVDPLIGQLVDEYRIEQCIGQGGMGVVYRAHHECSGEPVAIKLMIPRLSQDPYYRRRFHIEANACSALKHECLVKLVKHTELPGGQLCLIMEYVAGETLAARIKRQPQHILDMDLTLLITQQVADALSATHANHIIHLDLKPENIILRKSADAEKSVWPVVLDFGIAKFLQEHISATSPNGRLLGTSAYMSPERCLGDSAVDGKSDVYALGCILYELLCGQPPFVGEPAQLMKLHPYQEPRKPRHRNKSIPIPLEQLILDMLQKQPQYRPSMSDVARRCRWIRTRHPGSSRRWLGRSALLLTTVAVIRWWTVPQMAGVGAWQAVSSTFRTALRRIVHTLWTPTGTSPGGKQAATALLGGASTPARPETIQANLDGELVHKPGAGASLGGNPAPDGGPADGAGQVDARFDGYSPEQRVATLATDVERTKNRVSVASATDKRCHLRIELAGRLAKAANMRILINGHVERPLEVTNGAFQDDGWFSWPSTSLTIDFSDQWVSEVALVAEVRDMYGCYLAVGSKTLSKDENCEHTVNIPMEDPIIGGYSYLTIKKMSPNNAGDLHVGTIAVDEIDGSGRSKSRLLECGERCECAVPHKTRIKLIGRGTEKLAFGRFAIPVCRDQNSNPCEVNVDDLPSHEISTIPIAKSSPESPIRLIESRFHQWKESWRFPGAQELEPPLIRLKPKQQAFYWARKANGSASADFANPAHFRSIHAIDASHVVIAGFGGVLVDWDMQNNSFLLQQVGERIEDGSSEEFDSASIRGRLTDFHAIRMLSDKSVVAIGSETSMTNNDVRETSRVWHNTGQGWRPEVFLRIVDAPSKPPIVMPRMMAISDAETLDSVLLGGLDGHIFHRRLGRIAQDKRRHIWGIARESTGHRFWLAGGGRDTPNFAEAMLLSWEEGGKPTSHKTEYGNSYRVIWINPYDDRDIWLGGLPTPSGKAAISRFKATSDSDGSMHLEAVPTCDPGSIPKQVLGIWGTDANNVWAVGANSVVHCDGVNPWRLMYQAAQGVDFVAVWGLPNREVWAVGFVRTKRPTSVPLPLPAESQTDHSVIVRLVPQN